MPAPGCACNVKRERMRGPRPRPVASIMKRLGHLRRCKAGGRQRRSSGIQLDIDELRVMQNTDCPDTRPLWDYSIREAAMANGARRLAPLDYVHDFTIRKNQLKPLIPSDIHLADQYT